MPRYLRPSSLAATSDDPDPLNGSSTTPPLRENDSINEISTDTGFCVG